MQFVCVEITPKKTLTLAALFFLKKHDRLGGIDQSTLIFFKDFIWESRLMLPTKFNFHSSILDTKNFCLNRKGSSIMPVLIE